LERERGSAITGTTMSEPRTAVRHDVALFLFARYPRLGEGKTRLARTLGPRRTFDIYRAMLRHSLALFGGIAARRRLLYLTGCSVEEAERFVVDNGLAPTWTAAVQSGADLGARMWRAAREVSPRPRGFLFLGADTPHLPPVYIRRALGALTHVPLVIGPSVDGGYYLLGLTDPRKSLFTNIDWGTDRVLGQTLSRLGREEYVLLPRWYDIDSEADLEKLRADSGSGTGEFRSFEVGGGAVTVKRARGKQSASGSGAGERATTARCRPLTAACSPNSHTERNGTR
jgi:uncharacterized protein